MTVIVAYKAGSGTDTGARLLASQAEKYVGKTLIINNLPGGDGKIGWTELVNSKPDGRTIGFINLPTFTTLAVQPGSTFAVSDVVPVCNQLSETGVVVVRANSPWKSLKELVDACNRNYVDFVWAIHPGQDIKWNEEDYQNLINKFNWMYDLGVRHFAIFFDDISGEGTNPLKQTELLNRLTEEFVKVKGDVSPLTVCPTDYSKLWANPTEKGSLAIYGKTLNPEIKVFWTGDVVCSDLTPETLDFINSRIKRPAYYWWNYPVTDYIRNFLLQGPVYGLDTSLTANETCGIVSNPMEHGEASKLALYGVADYTWNIANYNAIDNWERGLAELVPEATDAYRTFAIHSSDTENGYRRDESWETQTFRLADWTDEAANALEEEFKKVESAPARLESSCKNAALINELRPWLTEFGKLGTRGKQAIELARIYRSGKDDALFWEKYIQNIMTPEDRRSYEAHKSGTLKLQPFYENAMDDMAHEYLKKLSGKVPTDYRGIGSFSLSLIHI